MSPPSKAAQDLALRIAHHYPTVDGCFDARVYQDAIYIEELVNRLSLERLMKPVPELDGSIPLVLYFGTEAERDGFLAAVQLAKPGLTPRKL